MSFFFDPVLLIAVVANTLLSAVVPRAICRWCRASAISDLLLNFNKKKSRASETTKLKMLVDSGTSGNVVSGKHIPKAHCKKDEQTKWNTQGGAFKTKSKSKIFLVFQEVPFPLESSIAVVSSNTTSSTLKNILVIARSRHRSVCCSTDWATCTLKTIPGTYKRSLLGSAFGNPSHNSHHHATPGFAGRVVQAELLHALLCPLLDLVCLVFPYEALDNCSPRTMSMADMATWSHTAFKQLRVNPVDAHVCVAVCSA